jgi:hypothetical protein
MSLKSAVTVVLLGLGVIGFAGAEEEKMCADSVVSLVVQGTGNGVLWKDRIDGKAPTTKQSGLGNRITQGACPDLQDR